jgi:hypothetical protein
LSKLQWVSLDQTALGEQFQFWAFPQFSVVPKQGELSRFIKAALQVFFFLTAFARLHYTVV